MSGRRKILLAAVGAATVTISAIACTSMTESQPDGPIGNLVPPPMDARMPDAGGPVGNLIAPPPDGSTV
ncbi:MAG TPA: hypothetical protein VKE22_23365 [Haliangiales bacterium]|nr:hypothetical protein [Haliangiales bacterium]